MREAREAIEERLARVVDIDPERVWEQTASADGDLSDVLDAARRVVAVDGDVNAGEKVVITEISRRADRG
ncbi:hypothetical protein [Rathayibacter tritici]|uniref:hypothetical protein n=1 Tax=Rathayibacter tritici TaxID=33888 RepID=UPI001CA4FBFA|nr:hypothetical protein [Rathayibacter tritici]